MLAVGATLYVIFVYSKGTCVEGNCASGSGIMKFRDGGRYVGQFQNGEQAGFGVYDSPRGHRYEGAWLDGKKHGRGTYLYPGGNAYSGEFRNNKKEGQGNYIWADGSVYSGKWSNGEPDGEGIFIPPGKPAIRATLKDGRVQTYKGEIVESWKETKDLKD